MRGFKVKWILNKSIAILGFSLLLLVIGAVVTQDVQAIKGKIYTDSGRYYKKDGYFRFTDNPRMEYKDYVITADIIEYYEDENKGIFTGNVVVLQGETRITSEKLEALLKDDEFIFDDQVNIYYVRKNKDENANTDQKNNIIEIVANHVVYTSGDDDHLIATGQVVMNVEDDNITSEYLEYFGAEEKAVAKDNVQVIGKDDEKISCEEFNYFLEGEEEGFIATDGVILEFTIEDDEETATPQPTTDGNPTGSDTANSEGTGQ